MFAYRPQAFLHLNAMGAAKSRGLAAGTHRAHSEERRHRDAPGQGWRRAGPEQRELSSHAALRPTARRCWTLLCCIQGVPSLGTWLTVMAGKGTVGRSGLRSRLASPVSSSASSLRTGRQSLCPSLPPCLMVTPGASWTVPSKEPSTGDWELLGCWAPRMGGRSRGAPIAAGPRGEHEPPSPMFCPEGPRDSRRCRRGRGCRLVSVPGSNTSTWGWIQRMGGSS